MNVFDVAIAKFGKSLATAASPVEELVTGPQPEQVQSSECRPDCESCERYHRGWCRAAKPGSLYNAKFVAKGPWGCWPITVVPSETLKNQPNAVLAIERYKQEILDGWEAP